MSDTIGRRWIGYDWFKLVVAIVLAVLLLLFRPGTGAQTTVVAPAASLPAATAAPAIPTAAPAVPAAIVAPSLTAPAAGATLATGPITFSGTAAPGAEIQVVVDGVPVGKARAGADGQWSLSATVDKPGDRQVVVQALDAQGAVAAAANPATVSIGAPAAKAPTIAAPAEGAIAGGSLTLSGTGTPGSRIEILDGDKVIGTAAVAADGTWSFPTAPQPGTHAYSARVAGDASAASAPVSVAVPAPQAPAAAQPPAITAPANDAKLNSGPFTMTGTAAPGAQIEILDSDKVIGTVTAGAYGTWSLPVTPSGSTAAYSVRPAGMTDVVAKPIRVTFGAAPAAACGGLAAGCDAWVTREGDLVLRMRAGAGTSAQVVARLPVGTQVKLLEGPRPADGYGWWRVRTLGEREGWVAGEELRTQPD